MDPTNYPLAWPAHKVRTEPRHRGKGKFTTKVGGGYRPLTVAEGCDRVYDQCEMLQASSVVISTNIQPTLAGRPRSQQSAPDDPGAAVYFKWRGKDLVFACDAWNEVAQNLGAIAAHIDALRGQERWGVASLEQAFMGHMQLPARGKPWNNVLGVAADAAPEAVESAYRKLAARHHPDKANGSHDRMAEINSAMDEWRSLQVAN